MKKILQHIYMIVVGAILIYGLCMVANDPQTEVDGMSFLLEKVGGLGLIFGALYLTAYRQRIFHKVR